MLNRNEFKNIILCKAKSLGWNMSTLAEKAGRPLPNVSDFLLGKRNTLDVALDLCLAVGESVTLAYATCGKPIPEPIKTTPEGHANAA